MTDVRLPARVDRKIGQWLEDTSRLIGRRKILMNGLKGAAVAVAGLTVGTLPGRASADPSHPYCHYPNGRHCSAYGKTCPTSGGCPSGCYVCTRSSGCSTSLCPYSSGYWITAPACGVCGYGYYLCYDCRCTSCSRICGCKSSCRCSGCCALAEVEEDMRRTLAEAAARN